MPSNIINLSQPGDEARGISIAMVALRWNGERISQQQLQERAALAVQTVDAKYNKDVMDVKVIEISESQQYVQLSVRANFNSDAEMNAMSTDLKRQFDASGIQAGKEHTPVANPNKPAPMQRSQNSEDSPQKAKSRKLRCPHCQTLMKTRTQSDRVRCPRCNNALTVKTVGKQQRSITSTDRGRKDMPSSRIDAKIIAGVVAVALVSIGAGILIAPSLTNIGDVVLHPLACLCYGILVTIGGLAFWKWNNSDNAPALADWFRPKPDRVDEAQAVLAAKPVVDHAARDASSGRKHTLPRARAKPVVDHAARDAVAYAKPDERMIAEDTNYRDQKLKELQTLCDLAVNACKKTGNSASVGKIRAINAGLILIIGGWGGIRSQVEGQGILQLHIIGVAMALQSGWKVLAGAIQFHTLKETSGEYQSAAKINEEIDALQNMVTTMLSKWGLS